MARKRRGRVEDDDDNPIKPPKRRKLASEKLLDRAARARKKVLEEQPTSGLANVEDEEARWNVRMPSGTVTHLTDLEAKFCARWLVHADGERAAIECGFPSGVQAATEARRIMRGQRVRAYLDERLAARARRYEVTAERIDAEMARIAFSNVADFSGVDADGNPYVDMSGASRDEMAAMEMFEVHTYVEGRGDAARDVKRVKFKLHDKRAALEALARKFNMYPSRHEVTGEGGGPVKMEDSTRRALVEKILALAAPQRAKA